MCFEQMYLCANRNNTKETCKFLYMLASVQDRRLFEIFVCVKEP